MKKLFIAMVVFISSSVVWAEEAKWYETTKDSHIFIKKDAIISNKFNTNIKTVIMAVNIPAFKDRHADPTKTALTNAVHISYLTEFIINCKDKTSKIGKQTLHEDFFGKGKILEEQEANPIAPFVPLDSTPMSDAMAVWEIACQPKDKK